MQIRLKQGPLIDSGEETIDADQLSELQELWDTGVREAFEERLRELGYTVDVSEPGDDDLALLA